MTLARRSARLALFAVFAALPALAHEGPGRHAPVPSAPSAASAQEVDVNPAERAWLAGDHHVHSRYSVGWTPDPAGGPPKPEIAGDAIYPIPTNAAMAARHGLSWMVSTDHGGPNHSKVNRDLAYPELQRSRAEVPGLIQFYGMEFDTPGADHSSLIIPHTPKERDVLEGIESRFAKREPWPADPSWDTEPRMLEALRHMREIEQPPVVIANHPSRSASGVSEWGQDRPAELRDWNDTAPQVAIGMEGAPGHQAAALERDGAIDPEGSRGGYRNSPTLGGFDQMTARLGGFWDSMLGEGRRWWVTSTSDSHVHYTDGGSDFWPGEYSKTYVKAVRSHADILDGLRQGRVFVTTGDLVSELDVSAQAGAERAEIGGTLKVAPGGDVVVTIRLRDPATVNAAGRTPQVARIDLIVGDVTGPAADRDAAVNPSTRVAQRFTAADWRRDGEEIVVTHTLSGLSGDAYVRVRGTSGGELEPTPDPKGEDPWSDLWFYGNPIFLEMTPAAL
ncbi:phosphoesterase [Phenylobacterium sp.]|uniref:phosphoesterase n=1 Tax=Phenylobacterium sp. TaxID=1871053 RepID=UPI0026110F54|nr:phosphoesterase [Phenylobacterium sp.]